MKKFIFIALFLVGVLAVSGCQWEEMTGNVLKENSASLQADKSLSLKGSTESNSGWLNNLKQSLAASSKKQFGLGRGEGIEFLMKDSNETDCLDADYNGDMEVTLPDLGMFAGYYSNQSIEADLNYDGEVTISDFALFGGYYNNCDYSNQSSDSPPVIEELEIDFIGCETGGGNESNSSINCDIYYHAYATDDYGIISAGYELERPTGGQGAGWPVNNLTSYYNNFTLYDLDDAGNYTLYFMVYDNLMQGDIEEVHFSLP